MQATCPARSVSMRCTGAQREFLQRALNDDWRTKTLGYGGSRHGGKTFSGSLVVIVRALMYPGTAHLAMRRVLSAADMNLGKQIKQLLKSFGLPVGLRSRGEIGYLAKECEFHFPNGSVIKLAYCKNESDYENYVGEQWDTIWIEQAEQFPEITFDQLKGSNRKSCDTPCVPRFLLTFNPGGRGSEWLYRRVINDKSRDKHTHFVKSLIRECLATLEQDPNYILRSLNQIKDPILRAQWLEGDWDAKSGTYFRLLPKVVEVLKVPVWADWYGGVDWGRSKPFAYLMVAHWEDRRDKLGNPGKRHIHFAKEVYARHLALDIQAERSLEEEQALRRKYPFMRDIDIRLADPRVFDPDERESTDTTRSKAEIWAKHGFDVYPAIAYSRVSRWELMIYLMNRGILTIDPEGCPNLINEIKLAVRQKDGEDIDQNKSNDHALDAASYVFGYLFGLDYSEETPSDGYQLRNFLRVA